ncbi:unnamed protein product, partial [Didymodactylos carnosus]
KSSLGNTLLGKKQFKAQKSPKSVTKQCEGGDRIFLNKKLIVVDAPGFLDTDIQEETIKKEISKSYQVAAPGPHVFLLVLNLDRFTEQEKKAIKWLNHIFGPEAVDYCIVIFTGLDTLVEEERTIEQFIGDDPELDSCIKTCGNRYMAINNKATGNDQDVQVKTLLDKISAMVLKNGGQCYTNDGFQEVATEVEKEIQKTNGGFQPIKPDGTINLLPQTEKIVDGFLRRSIGRRDMF